MERRHIEGRVQCPHLPRVERVWTAWDMAQFRGRYDGGFYLAALRYAQSLWLEAKPAQSLLQMNKALMAELGGSAGEPESAHDSGQLLGCSLPYAAKRWVLQRAGGDEFLGNPVRHYQHLATRMSGPRAELRAWRAWACFHLAARVLPSEEFPRDETQITREGLVVPGCEEVFTQLARLGLSGEARLVARIIDSLTLTDQ